MKKILHEKIVYLKGRWILSERSHAKRKWTFVYEGKTPAEVFSKCSYTAGVCREVTFDIQIFREEV